MTEPEDLGRLPNTFQFAVLDVSFAVRFMIWTKRRRMLRDKRVAN